MKNSIKNLKKKKKKNRTRVARFNFASSYSKKRNNNFWPQKWTKTFFIQFVYSFPLKYILLPVLKKKKSSKSVDSRLRYFILKHEAHFSPLCGDRATDPLSAIRNFLFFLFFD